MYAKTNLTTAPAFFLERLKSAQTSNNCRDSRATRGIASCLCSVGLVALIGCGGGESGAVVQAPTTPVVTVVPIVPTPLPEPVAPVTAARCFDSSLRAAKTNVGASYAVSGDQVGTASIQTSFSSATASPFGGGTSVMERYVNQEEVIGNFTAKSKVSYYEKTLSPNVYELLGSIATSALVSGGGSVTNTYTQHFVDARSTLSIGQTATYSGSGTATTVTPFASSANPTVDMASTLTVKFWGAERVTVPAGTYDACRYEILSSSGPIAINLESKPGTVWIYRGVPIKHVAGGVVRSMTSGAVSDTTDPMNAVSRPL
jgi:hypothetical protein